MIAAFEALCPRCAAETAGSPVWALRAHDERVVGHKLLEVLRFTFQTLGTRRLLTAFDFVPKLEVNNLSDCVSVVHNRHAVFISGRAQCPYDVASYVWKEHYCR